MLKLGLLLWFSVALQAAAYKTIMDVLSEDAQFTTLIAHLQGTRLVPLLNQLEAGTFFAPNNDAFTDNVIVTEDVLLYHLLPVTVTGQDFYDNQLLVSMYVRPQMLGSDNSGQRIKVTQIGNPTKGRGTVFVNGAKIIQKNVPVNNATWIHVIQKVLQPPPLLVDTLPQYTETYKLITAAGLETLLKQAHPFTVFVSERQALEKYNAIERVYLTSTYGKRDLEYLIKFMILDGVLYAADFPNGKTEYKTLSGEFISVLAAKETGLSVGGMRVKDTNILAANGVIHMLEDNPLPTGILFDTRKYLYGLNATTFVSMLDQYHLGNYLKKELQNHTFLAPPNEDLEHATVPGNMADWLRYHILPGDWRMNKIQDKMLLQTSCRLASLGNEAQRLVTHVTMDSEAGQVIQFGRGRVLRETVIDDNVIYQISEPLMLPGEILSNIVADLSLSSFIAMLYVSDVAFQVSRASGITLFVPTNDAFQELGIVAKYLALPSAKHHLQAVLRFHVTPSLLYHSDLLQGVHEVTTLAQETLRIEPQKDGTIAVHRPDQIDDVGHIGVANTLCKNGVVHQVSRVQLPHQVRITNEDLLLGAETSTMLEIFEKAGLLPRLNQTEVVILAPTDKALASLDIPSLLARPEALARLAKFHVIPTQWRESWMHVSEKEEYSTLLSERDKVIFQRINGDLLISVKGQPSSKSARVIEMGKASAGYGGVLVLDTMLIPVRHGLFGLSWFWSVVLVSVLSAVVACIFGVCSFFGYKIWTRRRLGYHTL